LLHFFTTTRAEQGVTRCVDLVTLAHRSKAMANETYFHCFNGDPGPI